MALPCVNVDALMASLVMTGVLVKLTNQCFVINLQRVVSQNNTFCGSILICFVATWATWSTWTSCQEVASNTCVHSRARQCVNGIMGDLECPVDGADQDAPCSCTCPTTVNARQQSGATSENDTGNGVVQLTLNILFVFCSILLI